jgi:Ca-activated chloride channel family protein
VMGVGTSTAAPIPLPRGGFLKDRDGTIVMPSLDEQTLRELAADVNGRYMPMQIDDSDLDLLLAESPLAGRAPTLAMNRTADSWEDQGYLLILPLLPLVLALFRRGWLLCLLPLLLIAQPEPASAASWDDLWLTADQQGQQALQQGDHERAAELFDNPAWAGTAAYQGGNYAQAAEDFSRGDDADSWYNRGNALARAGKVDEALAAYQASLQRDPDREDALANIALLEQLRQQNQEQEQQQQDQQQDQDQDQDQQQQDQNQRQQQDQQQQEQDQQQQDQNQQQQQDQQQQEQDQQQQQEQQQQEQDQQQQQEQQQQEQDQQQQQEQDREQQQQATAAEEADPESQERDQAMEQWLRRVPDDPSGLLREKFRYESYQRQQQGAAQDNDIYW